MYGLKNKHTRRTTVRVVRLSTLSTEATMGFLRRNRKEEPHQVMSDAVQLSESEVINYVSVMPEEEYKKLLKKFTAHRDLEKRLHAIEDGDIEETISAMSYEDSIESRKDNHKDGNN